MTFLRLIRSGDRNARIPAVMVVSIPLLLPPLEADWLLVHAHDGHDLHSHLIESRAGAALDWLHHGHHHAPAHPVDEDLPPYRDGDRSPPESGEAPLEVRLALPRQPYSQPTRTSTATVLKFPRPAPIIPAAVPVSSSGRPEFCRIEFTVPPGGHPPAIAAILRCSHAVLI